MNSIIEITNISVHYGQTEALKNISLIVEKGDFIGLAGPNGAGKTTLVKALLGVLPVSQGEIKLFGTAINNFNDWGKIGYLPQKNSGINILFPVAVDEVVMLGLLSQKKFPKRITAKDKLKVNEILNKLEINNIRKKMFSELSGGQQQKVLLARALVSDPLLLIFDEPSTALDPNSRKSFFELIQNLNKKQGITMMLITHDTGYIGKYAQKLLYIDKKVIYFGDISKFCKSKDHHTYFEKSDEHIIWHQHI